MKSKNNIHYIKARKEVNLIIHSKKIFNDLSKYGVIERKSLTSSPNLSLIRKNFQNDFIRGLFDGDGSAAKSGSTYICGNKFTIDKIEQGFKEKGFTTNKFQNKVSKVWYVYFGNKKERAQLLKEIWPENKFCLKRKRDRIAAKVNSVLT